MLFGHTGFASYTFGLVLTWLKKALVGTLLCSSVFNGLSMGKKASLRKRIMDAASAPEQPEPASSSSTPMSRSVRARVVAHEVGQADPSVVGPLPLVESLKKDWAKGMISAVQVQRYAMGASQQGAEQVAALSKAGSSGRHAQNVHRSLMRLFGIPDECPEMLWVYLPTKRGIIPHPVLLPHRWFVALASKRSELFASAVRGPDGGCREYWDKVSGTPFKDSHPSLDDRLLSKTIPLGFYGDAGSYSHQDSLYCFTWNSLLGEGQTMSKRFVCTVVRKSDLVANTFDELFRILSWSFNVILGGIWPSEDWLGRPLTENNGKYLVAGGVRGCMAQVRGDWEFFCSIFAFPKWNEATNMCWMCGASSSGPLTFADCSRDAPGEGPAEHMSPMSRSCGRMTRSCLCFSDALVGFAWSVS